MNTVVRLTGSPGKALLLLGYLAAGLATRTVAGELYIHPTVTGYAWYYGDDAGGHAYGKSYGDLWYGGVLQTHYFRTGVAFLKFNLDSLPDSSTISDAELDYCQYESYGVPQVDVGLISDPVPLDTSDLFYEIANAPAITPMYDSPDGWVSLSIDTASLPLLDSCRRAGWCSFGLRHHGGLTVSGFAYGYDSSAAPYLHLVYRSSGMHEAQSAPMQRSWLIFEPNPARAASVTVDHNIAVVRHLTLRDALGRAIRSFSLDPAGRTRLDLRGLAPGVYMAALDAGPQSLSRKLVISR